MSSSEPLWEAMDAARFLALHKGCNNGVAVGAEIRAVADWLLPEEPILCDGGRTYEQSWIVSERERLRNLLLDEADRAEQSNG